MEHPAKILSSLGIVPSRAMGQNFLADMNIARKIADSSFKRRDHVVEIGPGLGVLTLLMAERGVSVKAIEVDRRLAGYLDKIMVEEDVEVINEDFLKVKDEKFQAWSRLSGGELKVVGNLPYSISGPLIFKLIEGREHFSSCYLMLQREVARRLASPEGNRNYGAPSVILQAVGDVKVLFGVSRNCFYPVPEVDSSFISVDFGAGGLPEISDFQLFKNIVNAAFMKRRKTITNALAVFLSSRGIPDPDKMGEIYLGAGIDPGERPEGISVSAYVALANYLSRLSPRR